MLNIYKQNSIRNGDVMLVKKRGPLWILMLVFVAVIISSGVRAVNGCFTEPSFVALNPDGCAEISEATARADTRYCGSGNALDVQQCMDDYFITSVSCSNVPMCQRNSGTWCTDTCQQVEFQAACADRSAWIPPPTDGLSPPKPSQCEQGCCVCSSASGSVCPGPDYYQKTRNECELACTGLGGVGYFNKDSGFVRTQCTPLCGNLQSVQGAIEGFVRSTSGDSVAGAIVSTYGTSATTNSDGHYRLENLPEGDTTIRITHNSYVTKQVDVQLISGEQKQVDIILVSADVGIVKGTVTAGASVPLPGARVTVLSAALQSVVTNGNGEFEIVGIPYGTYSVEASATHFQAQRKSAILGANSLLVSLAFALMPEETGTITGIVTEKNTGDAISHALIYIDNSPVPTRLSGSDGTFSISKPASAAGISYSVYAEHPDYVKSTSQTVTLTKGESVRVDFELAPKDRACEYPSAPPVVFFDAEPVGGEKMVRLRWEKPCAGVAGYILNRSILIQGFSRTLSKQIAFIDALTAGSIYEDNAVDWGTPYEYDIVAVYADGPQPRKSNRTTADIRTGDQECEGKYNGARFAEFCDGTIRKVCTVGNKVTEIADCSGTSTFCAGPINGITYCEDTSVCSSEYLDANPFGLWFTQAGCYGAFDATAQRYPNFCTFDRTNTIFDACVPCNEVKSCFDYKGQEACVINNCYAGSCAWVDAAPELGTGYCVATEARGIFGTQQCGQCGTDSTASLFTGSLCTSEICSALGACYADEDESSCIGCIEGISSCYDFTSEIECIGSGESASFVNGALSLSNDVCGLGRCSWDDQHDICFKDGNGDSRDDCAGSVSANCMRDTIPPVTHIEPEIIRVNDLDDVLQFRIEGGGSGKLYYCIDKLDSCTPHDVTLYRSDGTLMLPFDTAGLGQVYDGTETYFIRYYSEDSFFNREDIQSKRFSADLDDPVIDIQHTIALNITGSDITFTILLDKTATCSDSLVRLGGARISQLSNNRTLSRAVTYKKLPDGLYAYRVDCTDTFGNTAHQLLSSIEVYAEGFIQIIVPSRAVKISSFSFEVNTTSPAVCDLFDDNLFTREPMSASMGSLKHTSARKNFDANRYYSNWRVVCTESRAQAHERHILFSVDLQPPVTTLTIVSSEGVLTRYNTTGFHSLTDNRSSLALDCKDRPLDAGQEVGFFCAASFFCFNETSECNPHNLASPFTLTRDGTLCFYSTDRGGNTETVKCGTLDISSQFGISVANPTFGISNTPHYDLEIHTSVPSAECKWAGFSGASFDFEQLVTAANNFTLISPHIFRIDNFNTLLPDLDDGELELIEIQCRSATGRISPSEIFEIGFDTTAPIITIHRAEPSLVTQGNSVDFVVVTNEPTICKYGQKPTYDQLITGFPGFSEQEFTKEHRARKLLVAADDNQLHVYNVSCMNRAENVSLVVPIAFEVNFSVAGAIVETLPAGVMSNTSATLTVRTSKNAVCLYADNASAYSVLGSSGILHEKRVTGLAEGSHSYPIQCRFSQPVVSRDATISFIIDRTPPVVHFVEDGNYSCSLDKIKPSISASDNVSTVVSYEYQLFVDGSNAIVAQGSVNSNSPDLQIVNLTEKKRYYFKVRAVDAAGNRGTEISSNGFTALARNATECKENRPPTLRVTSKLTRTGASATLVCTDETGCVVTKYGTAEKKSECSANISYTVPVMLTKDSHFCVYAEDSAGNHASDSLFIAVPDEDGDGVPDEFDDCSDTPDGDSIDADGCANSQLHIDADGDGLPDNWELRYDAADCPFDPHEKDTDADGIEDGDEDYDTDKVLNIDEFRSNSDPCRKAAVLSEPRKPDSAALEEDEGSSSLFGVMLIIFGTFFFFGGITYLIYITFYSRGATSSFTPVVTTASRPMPIRSASVRPLNSVAVQKRETRRQEEMEKRRKIFSAFSAFGSQDVKKAPSIQTPKPISVPKAGPAGEQQKSEKNSSSEGATADVRDKSAFERLEKFTGTSDEEADKVLDRLSQVIKKHKKGKNA